MKLILTRLREDPGFSTSRLPAIVPAIESLEEMRENSQTQSLSAVHVSRKYDNWPSRRDDFSECDGSHGRAHEAFSRQASREHLRRCRRGRR